MNVNYSKLYFSLEVANCTISPLPDDLIEGQIISYTAYKVNILLASENFHILCKNYLLREFRNFYKNRAIKHLNKFGFRNFHKLEDGLTDIDFMEEATKAQKKAKEAKKIKEKEKHLDSELNYLIEIYKFLLKLLKTYQKSKYEALNDKDFEKGATSYAKALKISEYVLDFYHFKKFFEKIKDRISFDDIRNLNFIKTLNKEFSDLDNNILWEKMINENVHLNENTMIKLLEAPHNNKYFRVFNCLDFNYSELMIIPNQLSKYLPSLEDLSLTCSEIKVISGLKLLTLLTILDLSENKIEVIEGLESLKSLKVLSLRNNKIKKISGLKSLVSLEILRLSNNEIEVIEGLENQKSLRHLALENNKIENISGLEGLTSLQFLNLDNNKIKKIIVERLENLKSLKTLFLEKNDIPKDTIKKLRQYYHVKTD